MNPSHVATDIFQVPLFENFSPVERKQLQNCQIQTYEFGQMMVRPGESLSRLIFVLSGKVRLVEKAKTGVDCSIWVASSGEVVPWFNWTDARAGNLSMRAMSPVTVIEIPLEVATQWASAHPSFHNHLNQVNQNAELISELKQFGQFEKLSLDKLQVILGQSTTLKVHQSQTYLHDPQSGISGYLVLRGEGQVDLSSGVSPPSKITPGMIITSVKNAVIVGVTEMSLLAIQIGALKYFPASHQPLELFEKTKVVEIPANQGQPQAQPSKSSQRIGKVPVVLQANKYDCGAACLTAIVNSFGSSVRQNKIREILGITPGGISFSVLIRGANKLGLLARPVHTSIKYLPTLSLPAIAHWANNHYVVVVTATSKRITVMDPDTGERSFSPSDFEVKWTGNLLMLEPTSSLIAGEQSPGILHRFLPRILQKKQVFWDVACATFALQVVGLANPFLLQLLLDRVVLLRNASLFGVIILAMVAAALSDILLQSLRQYLLLHAAQRIDITLVLDFFHHLIRLPVGYFRSRTVGDIAKRFRDNATLRDLLSNTIISVIFDIVTATAYFLLMLAYNVKLSLISVASLPLYVLLLHFTSVFLQKRYREQFVCEAANDSLLVEFITGIETLKVLGIESRCQLKLEETLLKGTRNRLRTSAMALTSSAVGQVLLRLNYIATLYFAADFALSGKMSLGQMIAFTTLSSSLIAPAINLSKFWQAVQEGIVAADRIAEVYETRAEEQFDDPIINLSQVSGRIEFCDVCFEYPGRGKMVLQKLNFVIEPGETVGIVGRSGSGKTTLVNLLLRLYKPAEGKILIDGQDITQLSLTDLRNCIGLVSQDIFLFDGTVNENIAITNEDAPQGKIIEAAKIAGAHDFITGLPLGYQTPLGERGQSLSGGQRQRLSIARTALRDPQILIFDEATSALDTATERSVQDHLRELQKGKTSILIAHRLSTLREANKILVLEEGQLVEQGTHQELLELEGIYFHLWRQQTQMTS